MRQIYILVVVDFSLLKTLNYEVVLYVYPSIALCTALCNFAGPEFFILILPITIIGVLDMYSHV